MSSIRNIPSESHDRAAGGDSVPELERTEKKQGKGTKWASVTPAECKLGAGAAFVLLSAGLMLSSTNSGHRRESMSIQDTEVEARAHMNAAPGFAWLKMAAWRHADSSCDGYTVWSA